MSTLMSKIIKILKSLIRPTGIAAFSPSKKIREKEREREREKRLSLKTLPALLSEHLFSV